jgi:hypothetical protein
MKIWAALIASRDCRRAQGYRDRIGKLIITSPPVGPVEVIGALIARM